MPSGAIKAKKDAYFARLEDLLNNNVSILVVNADNVGSQQFHNIRRQLRGKATILMGKNTMVRKCMKGLFSAHPALEKVYPHVVGNVGLVFTNDDVKTVRDILTADRVPAAAKVGVLAPVDVFVQPGNTGMGPEKTAAFQLLGVSTKITKGTIEILQQMCVVKAGDRVTASQSALLAMLKITPFTYGLVVNQVYSNGDVFRPEVLDITDDKLLEQFQTGLKNIAAISLATGLHTKASVAHSFMNGWKKVLAIGLASDYTFPLAEEIKNKAANAAAAPVAAAAPAAAAAAPAAAPKEEPKEESDEDMGFGLFD